MTSSVLAFVGLGVEEEWIENSLEREDAGSERDFWATCRLLIGVVIQMCLVELRVFGLG